MKRSTETVIAAMRRIADLLEAGEIEWVGTLSAEFEPQYIEATTLDAVDGQREAYPVRFVADALLVRTHAR